MIEPGTTIQVGDELIEQRAYATMRIVKVAHVTPTGYIVLENGARYRPDGRATTSDSKWHANVLSLATPERRKEALRQAHVNVLNGVKWEQVDADVLAQIVALLAE